MKLIVYLWHLCIAPSMEQINKHRRKQVSNLPTKVRRTSFQDISPELDNYWALWTWSWWLLHVDEASRNIPKRKLLYWVLKTCTETNSNSIRMLKRLSDNSAQLLLIYLFYFRFGRMFNKDTLESLNEKLI